MKKNQIAFQNPLSFLAEDIMKANHSPQMQGGSYSDLKKAYQGAGQSTEIHHMPAYSAYKDVTSLSKDQGACIAMSKADHQKTASWGAGGKAQSYRDEQKQLIANGKIDMAFQMDKRDIQSKFGSQYDKGINQAESHLQQKVTPSHTTAAKPQTLESLKKDVGSHNPSPSNSLDGKLGQLKANSPQPPRSSPAPKSSPHPSRGNK
jgi:hypothetical protein